MIVAIRRKICTSPSSMVAPQSPRGFEKSDWPTPIQPSYLIGPCNLHYLLFSGIGALLCHHPHCFPSQSQTLFGMGAGSAPILSRSQVTFWAWKYLRLCWREGWGVDVVVLSTFWIIHIGYYNHFYVFSFIRIYLFIYFFNLLNLYSVTRYSLLRYSV